MAKNYNAGSASVDISPDFSGFITKLRAELERIDASIEIPVSADTTRARTDIDALREVAGRNIVANIDADVTGATAQIEAFREVAEREVTVKVHADTSGISNALSGLGGASLLNLGAIGVGNLPAAATALASIASSVQEVSQVGLLLPGIFAGAGAGISTLVVGLQGFKDALGDNPKKAAAAYDDMAASAREVVDVTKSFDEQLKNVRQTVQGTLLDGVAAPLKQTISSDIPALEQGMKGVAASFNTGIKTTLSELGTDQTRGSLTTIFGNTATAAGNLNGSIVPIIDSMRRLGETGSTFLPEMAQGFTNLTTRFDRFIADAEKSGDLAKWMREGIEAAEHLGSTVENLGSSLASILRAAKGDGDGFLTTVDHLTERMATWLKSTEGQTELRQFFQQGRDQLESWKPILESLPSLLKSVYDGVQTWSGIAMPFLQAAARLLGDHPQLVQQVVTAYLAFKTVAPIFDLMRGSISAAGGALGSFKKGASDAAEGGAGRLGSAMGGVSTLIGSALGGPWGLAIGAATLGLGYLATKHQEAAQKADEQRIALESLGQTLDKQSGLATKQTQEQAAQMLEKGGFLERAQTLGVNTKDLVNASTGIDAGAKDSINQQLTGIILEQQKARPDAEWAVIKERTGLSDQDIAEALQGMPAAVEKYTSATEGLTGKDKVSDLRELKNNLNDIGESAATLGGELNNTNSELARMGEANRRTAAALGQTAALTKQGADEFRGMGIAIENVTALDGRTVMVRTPTDEQKAKLGELGHIVKTLPDGSVKVVLDDAKARADITDITKPETKNVTVSVTNPALAYQFLTSPGITAPGAPAVIPKAAGGEISGGIPGVDSVPILGMPGEHMLDTEDVERMGGQAGVYRFRAALKAGLVRGMASGGAVGWTNDDEQKLQQAIIAQQKAEQDQKELAFKKNVTDVDRRAAQQKVDSARTKVQQLEQQKANGGKTPTKELPQVGAPDYKSKHQIDIENAEMAVDEANTKRNQVYSNPNSTDNDKRRADNDYLSSQRALRSAQKAKDEKDKLPDEYSVPGILSAAGGLLGAGILSFFGLENSVLSGSNPYNKAFNQIVKHYTDEDKEAAEEADDTNTGYTPKNLPVEDQAAKEGGLYTGGGYTGYSGYSGSPSSGISYSESGGVEQWRSTFAAVLAALGMPQGWLNLGLAQMQTESGGNPKAINLSDSNAAKGTPSKGLMQVIDPTFAAYRSGLYPNDIWDPNANIAAALRYTVDRYGGPEGVWGQGHGYDQGGIANGIGLMLKQTIKPERVLDPRQTEVFESSLPLLESINSMLGPSPLPEGMVARGSDSRSVTRDHSVNFHGPVQVMDMDHLMREQDRWAGIQAQGALVTH